MTPEQLAASVKSAGRKVDFSDDKPMKASRPRPDRPERPKKPR